MRALLVLCTGFAVLGSVDAARADDAMESPPSLTLERPPSLETPQSREPAVDWYGWQSLLPDLVGIGLFAAVPFIGGAGAPVALADWPGLLVIGPAVHNAHRRRLKATLSFVLRLTLPLSTVPAGMAIAHAQQKPCTGFITFACGLDALAWGAYGGLLAAWGAAALVDAFVMGWGREGARAESSTAAGWTILPTVSQRGAGMSLAGGF